MKYYSLKRIVLSIIAAVVFFFIVGGANNDVGVGLIAGGTLLAILLPKIWWNFVLERIREIAKAIKDND